MANSKQQKQCYIKVRVFVKRTASICCLVVNGEGKQYTTCLHANGHTSCTCKAGEAGQKCYHIKHVVATEAARREKATQASKQAAMDAEITAYIAEEVRQAAASNYKKSEQAAIADLPAPGALTITAQQQAERFLMLPSRQKKIA